VSRKGGKLGYKVGDVDLDPVFDVMHIPGMRMPGSLKGLSPIAYARETIGLGLSAQRFGAAFFDNGALPSAVIEAPNEMKQDAVDRFKAMWNDRHAGVGNAHKIGVLTQGATLNKVSIAPNDAQFLETRQFQVPDIARIFGVPPHLIAELIPPFSDAYIAALTTAIDEANRTGWYAGDPLTGEPTDTIVSVVCPPGEAGEQQAA
jgi:HK97 family phage portal protein